MAVDGTSLSTLEGLLTLFFSSDTNNEKKRQIEQMLDGFKNQPESWRHCLNFLSSTSNQFVMMYCLTVLEHVINKQWILMAGPDKSELRSRLHRFMVQHYQKVPNFVCNKLGKLEVDIGRNDWPHFYPDFFVNIHQLAQAPETAPLGLMLLQTVFEEFTCPREDMAVIRKDELHRLLLEQVPLVLNILSGHLESVLEKQSHLVTATPPPSPTHYQNSSSQQSLFSTSPLHTGSLLSGVLNSPAGAGSSCRKSPLVGGAPLDAESRRLSALSLQCLAQLLAWIPLSSYVSSHLLNTVFHFAGLGCQPRQQGLLTSSQSHMETSDGGNSTELGIQAMSCINEIMSKHCVPADYEGFLLQVFHDAFRLLQCLTKEEVTQPSGKTALAEADETYVEKFTEFLQLFVNLHLRRFESNAQFPILEFLALLFKYTFQQPGHDGFYACLDIWNTFLDYLVYRLRSQDNNCEGLLLKYKEALLSLVEEIFRKLQFRYNQASLEELDDEDLDDDSMTEWQQFLCQCLEVASKVSELMPLEVFALVTTMFEENLRVYLDLEGFCRAGGQELGVCGENELRRLHCSLRDLSSALQGLGRLVEHLCGDHFERRKEDAQKTLERLCHAATYSNRMRFYDMKTSAPLVLQGDFVQVHAQVLATLKAYCHWLTQYNKTKVYGSDEMHQPTASDAERVLADIAIANIHKKVPEKVTHSAAHLLASLTCSVRPPHMFRFESAQQLLATVARLELRFLPLETQLVVYRCSSNMLVLPWPGCGDGGQAWQDRSPQHDALLHALSSLIREACSQSDFFNNLTLQERARPEILWVLKVLCGLIENVCDASTRSKQVFYKSLQSTVPLVESLFHTYLQQPDATESILEFFLCLFSAFRTQIGLPFVEKTIHSFLTLFTSNQVMEVALNESSSGFKVIEKLLQLLQQVVQEPSSHFKSLLPSTISFCIDQIYPIVAQKPQSEVRLPLFDLLHRILLHNWRHFFRSDVACSLGEAGHEEVHNRDHFNRIMEAYGQTFLQPDINLFKQNLASLETLNVKWKLYHKGYFRDVMLGQFLQVLLQALVQRSYNLLQEEIVASVYNMASVNYGAFFSAFLPQFVNSFEALDANQRAALIRNFKRDTDLHSFSNSIQRFVSDLRHYCLYTTNSVSF